MQRNYSKVIEELRTDYGLNLVAIGQRIGIDPRTVGKWWQGKHKPNQDNRKKLNALYREVKENMNTQTDIIGIDSRTVADWTNKPHYELMKDIRRYSDYLKQGKIPSTDFWQETTYKASNGKLNPCYIITKKGCEFIQHKMTGQKGTVFTAKYINYFWEQGEQLQEITQNLLNPKDDSPTLPNDYYTEDGAERHFIDTLTRLMLEATELKEKERLNQRLRVFMENRIYYRP